MYRSLNRLSIWQNWLAKNIVAFLPNQYRASTVFLAVEAVWPNFCKVSYFKAYSR